MTDLKSTPSHCTIGHPFPKPNVDEKTAEYFRIRNEALERLVADIANRDAVKK